MHSVEAFVDEPTLDALALLPQPLEYFRLLPSCATCTALANEPVSAEGNEMIRRHAIDVHPDRISDLNRYVVLPD